MTTDLNADLEFDEVRWATFRKTSYDKRPAFLQAPVKSRLAPGTRLFRLIEYANGQYFQGVWWIPQHVYFDLQGDAERSRHGGGRLFRNYLAQYLALPNGDTQLSTVEIEIISGVFAWTGLTAPFKQRPGGVEQIYLPNLAERGDPSWSRYAAVKGTYWLRF